MAEQRCHIRIDANGQVTTEGGAHAQLSHLAGRYRLLPSSNSLLILQRNEEPATTASSGHVVLAGEIDQVGGAVDVIHFIESSTWSGQLSVVDGAIQKTLSFWRGEVRSASSNVLEDRLGAILYRFGVVSEEALEEALHSPNAGAKLGQLLVDRGALTAHELYQYIRKQVEEIFFSILVLRQGQFYFCRNNKEEAPTSQLQLSTKALLFDGVRRIDEMSHFRQKLPSVSVVLVRRHPQPSEGLPPLADRLLTFVDGSRTLETIARDSHLGEFETTKLLFQLLQSGFVENRRTPSNLRVPVVAGTSLVQTYRSVLDTFNQAYQKIYATLAAKGKQAKLEQDLESFFRAMSDFAPLFVGVSIAHDGKLSPETVIANLDSVPSDNKLEYLQRGLNELLFYELFTAGEAVDRFDALELHQRLDQILRDMPGAHVESDLLSERPNS